MSNPPFWLLAAATAMLALGSMAVALMVASTPPRARSRRLPGGWAFLAILMYASLEVAGYVLTTAGHLPAARWLTVCRSPAVVLNVLAWRAVLVAAYPGPAPESTATPLTTDAPEPSRC